MTQLLFTKGLSHPGSYRNWTISSKSCKGSDLGKQTVASKIVFLLTNFRGWIIKGFARVALTKYGSKSERGVFIYCRKEVQLQIILVTTCYGNSTRILGKWHTSAILTATMKTERPYCFLLSLKAKRWNPWLLAALDLAARAQVPCEYAKIKISTCTKIREQRRGEATSLVGAGGVGRRPVLVSVG